MIPYIDPPRAPASWSELPIIGSVVGDLLQPFVILVGLGVFIGWRLCLRYAKARNIDDWMARDVIFWVLLIGFCVSHWVSVIFYFPERMQEDPWVLLHIFNGLSSVGGFLGAFIGLTWFLSRQKQPKLIYCDMLIFGLLVGWCFGRLGCTLTHDHPGRIVTEGEPLAFLSVGPWPCSCVAGGWAAQCCAEPLFRFDLGLYEFALTLVLTLIIFAFFPWRTAAPGRLTGLVTLVYAPSRFVFDFFRESKVTEGVATPDLRYAGLTIAQWLTLMAIGAGIWLVFFRRQQKSDLDYAKEADRLEMLAKRKRERAAATAAEQTNDDSDNDAQSSSRAP